MQRKRVLVVDDIPLMRTMLRKYIELLVSARFPNRSDVAEVIEAENGAEALHIMQSQKVDFIFLDLMMPELDGLTFLEQVNENDEFARVPIVITTALDEETGIGQAQQLGVERYIRKPFTLEEVERELEPLFEALQPHG